MWCDSIVGSRASPTRFRIRLVFVLVYLVGCKLSQTSGAFVAWQALRETNVPVVSSKLGASLSSEEVRARLLSELEKLREKDRNAKVVRKEVSVLEFSFLNLVFRSQHEGM